MHLIFSLPAAAYCTLPRDFLYSACSVGIRNRDYNLKNGTDRKIIVVVDECHLFIAEKYPIALDFMYQMAKRIRKYNGMEIVITQSKSIIISSITFFALLHLHISAEHSVDFLCRLFEITSVHAVVGADGRRYVLVTEQLLNDFRILSAFK